jgi:hypothetical protein
MIVKTPKACKEADFEALTREGDTVFAITSHSRNRAKQKDGATYAQNRQKLNMDAIETCDSRHQLRKFRLTGNDKIEPLQDVSLRDLLESHPVLGPFAHLPNKENGIDIEGLAAKDGMLYVGFRGPVLRQNFVPILRIPQDLTKASLANSETLFVNLGGRGIRDIAPAPGGFVILAGPNGDEAQSFAVYFWNGQDQIGGSDRPASVADLKCDLGPSGASKPEGIAWLQDSRFMLVYDGPAPLRAELLSVK